jgi:hypothetical protein
MEDVWVVDQACPVWIGSELVGDVGEHEFSVDPGCRDGYTDTNKVPKSKFDVSSGHTILNVRHDLALPTTW